MLNNRVTATPMAGEQGVPDIDDAGMIPWKKYGLITAGVMFALSYGYAKLATSDTAAEAPKVVDMAGANVPPKTFTTPLYAPLPEPITAVEPAIPAPPEALAVEQSEPVIVYSDRPAPVVPRIDKGRSKAMVTASVQMAATNNAPVSLQQAIGNESMQQSNEKRANDGVERGYASTLSNTDRLVLQGVVIPCTLNNAINTQLRGNASCTVSRDIWSADNSQILIAKGSRANGEYQIETTSGAVTRIGVQWGRIRTTDNQVALLGSPASDQQGASGIPADSVNYHFWAKFGTSLAVSLIEGVFSTIGSTGNSNGDVVINSATGTTTDLASQVLAATVNLPATRKANAGSEVAIFLQRDIEFEAAR